MTDELTTLAAPEDHEFSQEEHRRILVILSDLLWLFGRKLELDAGVSGSLRSANAKVGPRWSRAW